MDEYSKSLILFTPPVYELDQNIRRGKINVIRRLSARGVRLCGYQANSISHPLGCTHSTTSQGSRGGRALARGACLIGHPVPYLLFASHPDLHCLTPQPPVANIHPANCSSSKPPIVRLGFES